VDETSELLQAFNFEVTFTAAKGRSGPFDGYTGAFAECSGLELEAEIKDYNEGGFNEGVIRRVGRVKLVPLVLKRGMFVVGKPGGDGTADTSMWDWITGMVGGKLPIPRYNGVVVVKDPSRKRVVAKWSFDQGLPSKVTGPALNAKTGEVAIEELHIVHQGLRLGN
jgi:phage tail-like protein